MIDWRDNNNGYSTDAGTAFPKLPGKYKCLVTGKGNYHGNAFAFFDVKKANNTLVTKAKCKKLSVKYKKLRKKARAIKASKAFKVTGAQGKVTYYKLSGNKKITVSKTGAIKIKKKGLKKGKTYKLKVMVLAAGNAYYNPDSATVTVKIKVK